MSRSSGRAQAEPLAALVALFAVCAAVSLYAGVLDGRSPTDRPPAELALDRVRDHAWNGSAVSPSRLAVPPSRDRLNATLSVGGRRWAVGPTPPRDAARASRPVAVRLAPGRVTAGLLRVVVW